MHMHIPALPKVLEERPQGKIKFRRFVEPTVELIQNLN